MINLLKKSILNWYDNDPFTRSAAIAYYTIFSFPALIIVMMGIANSLIDKNIIETSIIGYLKKIIGKDAAVETFQIVDRVNINQNDNLIFIFGIIVILFTALRLFMQLQKGLNDVWDVETNKFSWKRLLRQRAYSFGLMISISFLLIVSLVVTSSITALSDWMSNNISDQLQIFVHVINFVISFAIISFLFTLILKILPDIHIDWKVAIAGGFVTTILFLIGQYALSIYFDIAEPQSAYGVSGSIILLMLWVSYSSVILLFGAEFSKAYKELYYEK